METPHDNSASATPSSTTPQSGDRIPSSLNLMDGDPVNSPNIIAVENQVQAIDIDIGDNDNAPSTMKPMLKEHCSGELSAYSPANLKSDHEAESLFVSKARDDVVTEHENLVSYPPEQPMDRNMADINPIEGSPHAEGPRNEIKGDVEDVHEALPPNSIIDTTDPKIKKEDDDEDLFVPPSNSKDEKSTSNPSRKRKASSSNASTDATTRKKQKPAAHRSVQKLVGNRSGQDTIQLLLPKGSINSDETGTESPRVVKKSDPKADEKALVEATKIFGKYCTTAGKEPNECNDMFLVKGMKTPLRDYQLVGAAFMLRHEKGREGPHGGIIADEMGLGKTLQAIACMLAHKPTRKDADDGCATTLIVMPTDNLIKQWMGEFEKHIEKDAFRKALHYKRTADLTDFALKSYEFIFATYTQVQSTYKEGGPLFDIDFYRIVLDEADKIKKKDAITSVACIQLRGKHKWALSGTPIPNNLEEILPYLKFIGIKSAPVKEDQNPKTDERKDEVDWDHIMKILSNRMLRREQGEIFMGRQICELPKLHEHVVHIDMTEGERLIYKCVEESTLKLLKETMERRKNREEKDPNEPSLHYYVLLTKLRQAADHPILLYTWMRYITPVEDIRQLAHDLERIKHKTPVYNLVVASCKNPRTNELTSRKLDAVFNFQRPIQHVLDAKDGDRCVNCSKTSDLRMLKCEHLLCGGCLNEESERCMNYGGNSIKCPECKKAIFYVDPEDMPELDQELEHLANQIATPEVPEDITNSGFVTNNGRRLKVAHLKSEKRHTPGDDFNRIQPDVKGSMSKWLDRCDKNPDEPLTPSAKTTAAMECIKDWQREAPDDKIIVFVQWAMTAKIMGRLLGAAEIPFLYYWGDMGSSKRERALNDFKSKRNIKVLVAGLKCGNQGLNITCANRAILLSPWWNRSVEDQAKGRIRRHGQVKETHCVHIAVKDSIDDRMLILQQKKTNETELAMNEGRKRKGLTNEERLRLLGQTEDQDESEL